MNQIPERQIRKTVFTGHVGLLGTVRNGLSNLNDLGLGQLGVAVLFSSGRSIAEAGLRCAPVFHRSVPVVLGNRTKEQVRRVAARWVIATMQDALAAWDWAKGKRVSHAMSAMAWPIWNGVMAVASAGGASPRPTFIRVADVDLRPEAWLESRFNHLFRMTGGVI